MNTLAEFLFESVHEPVTYQETIQVKKGVLCDVYTFRNRTDCDLGIITVENGFTTPLQLVVGGLKTIEGFLDGNGELHVQRKSNEITVYRFPNEVFKEIVVNQGDIIQWQANQTSQLLCYEICFPPYQDGRFETLENRFI